jgi:uncharacterized membrane protein YfcA
VGGGAVMVPLLTGQLGLSQHRAHATSLAIIPFIALAGMLGYWRAGNIDWQLVLTLCPPAMAGVLVGARTMPHVPALQLRMLFGAFLFFVAFRQLAWQASTAASPEGWPGLVIEMAFGFGGGLLAGMLGVGGGAIFVPAIVIFDLADVAGGGDPQKVAQGVSLAVIVATGLIGTLENWRQGTIAAGTGAFVAPAAVVAAVVAALVANRIDVDLLKRIYGITALALGLYTVYTSIRGLRAGRAPGGMEMEPV